VIFEPPVREALGRAVICKAAATGAEVLCVAVDDHHLHALARLDRAGRREVKRAVGRWKQAASHAVRGTLPGAVWAGGCDPVPIADRRHQVAVFRYVLRHRRQGAWVWSFLDGGP
jgi:REP element-mobilizing transposase RayT